MDALFAPPAQLAPHLQKFRFWIWLQLVALRLYVRARRGPGVRFHCLIDRQGNVYLDYICADLPEPDANPFAFEPSAAYRAALDGHAASENQIPHPLRRQGCEAAATEVAFLRPCLRRGTGPEGTRIPDT